MKRPPIPWLQLIRTLSVVVIAVALVRIELRHQHNDRIRTLCAAYWGAPDAGEQERRAWEETKKLVGVSGLEMLSFCRFYGDQ